MSVRIRPFTIDISDSEIDRMKRKLRDTRLPPAPIVPDAGDDYGPSMPWIHDMYNKLLAFDWPAAQARLNGLTSHYLATIPDGEHTLTIHFTHTVSLRSDAIPLLLIHGWPGSFHEFTRLHTVLGEYRDLSTPACHLICPSLPGFPFSSPPPRRGWTMQDTARVLNKLMLSLSYTRYAVQAGDWGMFAARELGARYPDSCRAVHLNFCPTPLPDGITLTDREGRAEARCQDWLDEHLVYAVCMRSRPHTLGVSLYDNPLGILLWVGEKYYELSHPKTWGPEWEREVLTTVCLYYFSGCIMTSMLPYFENVKHAGFGEFVLEERNRIRVPLGFLSCMYDSRPGTKRGVERSGDLVWYREEDELGHFAALEGPEILAAELRGFLGQHYTG